MNFNRNLATMLQANVVLVRVVFDPLSLIQLEALQKVRDFRNLSQKSWVYKALATQGIKVGDHLVVQTADGQLKTVRCIAVGEPIDLNADFEYKFIVQRIDLTAYQICLDHEEKVKEMLLTAERQRQTDEVIEQYKKAYPEGTPARQQLDEALAAGQKAIDNLPGIAHEK